MKRKPYANIHTGMGTVSAEELREITNLMNSEHIQGLAYSALVALKQVTNNDTELSALAMTIAEMKTGIISKRHSGLKYEELPDGWEGQGL